ncbi:hypothetical protein Barb7_02474 [Bacteroidales bacterium Barb7]|nr:hypothetical protein Barb7_02474 [Bacteroidales bacterium Barb7]
MKLKKRSLIRTEEATVPFSRYRARVPVIFFLSVPFSRYIMKSCARLISVPVSLPAVML